MKITLAAILVFAISGCAQVNSNTSANPGNSVVPRIVREVVPPGPPADFTPKQVSYAGQGAE